MNASTATALSTASTKRVLSKGVVSNNAAFEYDSAGAAKYVIVVILWYFLGVATFVAWQVKRKRSSNDYKTELLLQAMEDQVKTKEILEELRNPEMRKWAWDIYRGENRNDKYERKVLANLDKRINKIEKFKQKYNDTYGGTKIGYTNSTEHVHEEDEVDSLASSLKSKLRDVRLSLSFSKGATSTTLPSSNKDHKRRQTMFDFVDVNKENRKTSEHMELKYINEKFNNLYGLDIAQKRSINVSFKSDKILEFKEFSKEIENKINLLKDDEILNEEKLRMLNTRPKTSADQASLLLVSIKQMNFLSASERNINVKCSDQKKISNSALTID